MSAGQTKWDEISKTLGIVAEKRTVYRAAQGRRARLTKETALMDALKAKARELDGKCQCSRGDSVTPADYCGCRDRILAYADLMFPVARMLPVSADKLAEMLSPDAYAAYWESNNWGHP